MSPENAEHPLPRQIHAYKGVFTDSARWKGFEHRPSDIFVCTPPKSGTTWTQAICALLVFKTPDLKVNPATISPWLDANFSPIEEILAQLDAQTHRRIIKTHTPLDGIPYFKECQYICVYRDPRDVFFSLRSHLDNMNMDVPKEILEKTPKEGFREWLATEYQPGEEQGPSLGAITHHLKTFQTFEDLPNIEIYHYSDLTRDLTAEMGRVADQLDIEVDPDLMSNLAEAASFTNMKKNADKFAPGVAQGAWKDTGRFFNRGTTGQWRDVITLDDEQNFIEKLNALLPPLAADWLMSGSD